jgi:hypothetical protein
MPPTHSVQLNKKESNKSEFQEGEESENDSAEENEMKGKTSRTKRGKLNMGMYYNRTSFLHCAFSISAARYLILTS